MPCDVSHVKSFTRHQGRPGDKARLDVLRQSPIALPCMTHLSLLHRKQNAGSYTPVHGSIHPQFDILACGREVSIKTMSCLRSTWTSCYFKVCALSQRQVRSVAISPENQDNGRGKCVMQDNRTLPQVSCYFSKTMVGASVSCKTMGDCLRSVYPFSRKSSQQENAANCITTKASWPVSKGRGKPVSTCIFLQSQNCKQRYSTHSLIWKFQNLNGGLKFRLASVYCLHVLLYTTLHS